MNHGKSMRPHARFSAGVFGWVFMVASLGAVAVDVPSEYLIQPGDALSVSVWHEPDMLTETLVRPDGRISIPLSGDVRAQGKSAATLRAEIAQRLEKLLPDAAVNVVVKQALGNKIYVIGKVGHPGEFVVARDVDVMQALSMAAGTVRFADLTAIKILRRDAANVQQAIPFNYQEVQAGVNLEQNILLHGGDVVVVP
jgi:polysaccharide biosynthesis/export protein